MTQPPGTLHIGCSQYRPRRGNTLVHVVALSCTRTIEAFVSTATRSSPRTVSGARPRWSFSG